MATSSNRASGILENPASNCFSPQPHADERTSAFAAFAAAAAAAAAAAVADLRACTNARDAERRNKAACG